MKKHLLTVCILLLVFPLTWAEISFHVGKVEQTQESCPAVRAAQLGYEPFEGFHKIMAPIWHQSWPEKDYTALLAAGPQFKEAFSAIAKLEPTFKTEARKKEFLKSRDDFGKIVDMYAAVTEKYDTVAFYEMLPKLHDAFEMTASTLLPVPYPEMEGVAITLKLIMETHLPNNNVEGIVGSTETLLSRFDILTDTTTIPGALKEKQTEIMAEIAAMKMLARQLKECCNKNDMKCYQEHATTLDKKLKDFFEKYI
jgi:hypothetical protein